MHKTKTTRILDGLIYFFIVLFLLSLTNSIFVNQVGYYFALIFILIRYSITKENQFKKTGLEFAFIWFMAAEILSAIFSQQQGQAFYFTLKRALLIPLVYTIIAATTDLNRAKKYFKFYIGASLITVLIYLFFAYRFYIYNLYSIEESGPSLFQYPITAAEILTFTVVFLFAFLVNEKTSVKHKIFIFLAFVLSIIALVSTYKRTGWTGAIVGILTILLIKKQWKIIIAFVFGLAAVFLMQKNISRVEVFSSSEGKLKKEYSFSTEGRAYDITPVDGKFYVSDYQNGLVEYDKNREISKINLPSTVGQFWFWKDKYYVASLFDSRFLLFSKDGDQMKRKGEFLTPGYTFDFKPGNGFFYVLDNDSGLTIYKNPELLTDTARFPSIRNFYNVFIDSSFMVLYSPPRGISVIKVQKGVPAGARLNFKNNADINCLFYLNKKLFVSDAEGLKLFSVDANKLTLLDRNLSMKKIFHWCSGGNKLFAADPSGNLYELKYPVENKIEVIREENIGFNPQSMSFKDGKLYTTYIKTSRLLSIFDLHHPSNVERFELWTAGWKMFKDHPLFGVGDIDLHKLYKQYKKPYNKELQGHMHNNFVHLLVTLGLFGFFAFCFLIIGIIQIEWKICRETEGEPFISSYSLGAIACFIAFLVAGLTEMNFGDHEIITLVWFTLGFDIALYNFFKRMKTEKKI